MKLQESQYILPFDAAKNDLLAQIRFLRAVDLGLGPARVEGAIQLLERLALLGNDLTELDGVVYVKAQVMAIAARVESRRSVSEKTIRNWRRDCEALGVLTSDRRSQRWGGHDWNTFAIDVARIREIVAQRGAEIPAGSGRKRPESISAPRAVTISAPRPVTVTAPNIEVFKEETNNERQTPVVVVVPFENSPGEIPSSAAELDRLQAMTDADEQRLVAAVAAMGVGRAEEAIAKARKRGANASDVEKRLEAWNRLGARERLPGKLYNWIAFAGSFAASVAPLPAARAARARSDDDRRQSIVLAGRRAGASDAAINERLRAAQIEELV